MHISEFKMKVRKQLHSHVMLCILTLLLVLVTVFIFHCDFLYKSTIATVKSAKTTTSGTSNNYNNGDYAISENTYTQTLTLKILNGTYKGTILHTKNNYSYSQIDSQKLRRGDKLFVKLQKKGGSLSCSILGCKRDSYAFFLLALFIYLILIMNGRKGLRIIGTLILNIGIFVFALIQYQNGTNILLLTNILIIIFTFTTILLTNGFHIRTWVAILATLLTLAAAIFLFRLTMHLGGEIDYAALDYIVGDVDLEQIFIASISLAGLGAVMDVAVTISSSLGELKHKKPDISSKELMHAGREIGYDIMGTMINVLLFTYVCGLIPLLIIKMKNQISILTIVRLQIPFEICRFLIGGIEILLAIPITMLLSLLFFRKWRK